MAGTMHAAASPGTPHTSTYRATLAIIGIYAALTLALLTVCRQPGPEMPGFNAAFGAGVFVADLATCFLLLILFRQTLQASVLVLASAFLFSALMAVAYLLAYPDAVTAGRALVGSGQTISWVYNCWIVGFALVSLAACALEAWGNDYKLHGLPPRVAAAFAATVAFLLSLIVLIVAAAWGDRLPMLSVGASWTPLNAIVNYGGVIVLVASVAIIFLSIGSRSDLFLWLSLALAAMALGNVLAAAGGGRYTVGWYACRLSWGASACVMLLYFMAQFVRQHGQLQRTTGDLAERTRERDRIWSVSEDLLGVSTFEGYFVAMNPAWTRVLGWSEPEVKSMHVDTLRHPDDALHSRAGRARLAQGVPTVRMENRFRHKDGSWRWIAWTMTADQGLIYVAGRHVTAEREAQEALRKAEADAAHRQKMEALGQLTGGVAHDFNNLLMVVAGFVPRVKDAVAHDEKATEAAQAIEIAAQRGAALTRQLLSFSRRQPINPVVVDIGARIEALRPLLTSTVGPFVDLQLKIAPDLWPAHIDVNEFELALLNLVLNARDAVAQKGSISIVAQNRKVAAHDTPDKLQGEFATVAVVDTGHGIAPDILPKVFDPFFTTKQMKGTGLGLSQVHGFSQQSGGTAVIDSTPGSGTTVMLYLPRSVALPERPMAAEQQPSAGGTALLVEDNASVAAVTRDMLMQLGFAVHTASSSQRALELLDRHAFDLVLSDIVMPGTMNGIELARTIRGRKPTLPIVLVSGYAGSASGAGPEFTVLRKPYRFSDLREAITPVSAATRERAVL
jgi:PAS domain S-box-containing protein